ncbi:hypothetical protein MLD38_016429 [Melastoma candidum]|uniref:Uncharacterized protein n=1 Tax=Melastoma candidum TaxID=119954 RepID=A0ACB9RN42_9MYRT|nr:hypothetical protein MLD38_016429 [Melastoma candidum]
MEKLATDLELAKVKKESIRKACEQVNSEASAVVMLCLQSEDLERHFDGLRKDLEVAMENLSQRERRLVEEERRLRDQMGIVEERECSVVPPEEGEGDVLEVLSSEDVVRCSKLDLKRRELESVQASLLEKSKQLKSTEEDLIRVGFRLEFQHEELIRVERHAREMRDEVRRVDMELCSLRDAIRVKEEELNCVKTTIDGCVSELKVKEGLLESIKHQIKDHREELASLMPSGKEGYDNDLMLMNGELGSVHLDIEKQVVETEGDSEQPTKRKLVGEDNSISPSKRERNGSSIPVDRLCGTPHVNPGSVCSASPTINCPDPDFGDFNKLRSHFATNQFWACYDNDVMPRYYARVDKVFSPGFRLLISWLVASPESQTEHDWSEKELPIACGYFELSESEETDDLLMFSHPIHCNNLPHRNPACFTVYPREGETWAIFKNWDISWSSDPEKHRPYKYAYVEILSDFDEDSGATVAYLCKLKGFVALFQRVVVGDAMSDCFFHILPHEKYRFSHQILSFQMTGEERVGVPAGSFELDPAGLDVDDWKDEIRGKTAAGNKMEEAPAVEKRAVVVGLTSRILGGKSTRNGLN